VNGLDGLLAYMLAQAVGVILLTLAIIGGVALFHHHIAYWAAAIIAFAVVYGGIFIFEGDWIE
jgi:hypothetical protein